MTGQHTIIYAQNTILEDYTIRALSPIALRPAKRALRMAFGFQVVFKCFLTR